MPVIERESEESWNQWVSSLERFMDGVEGFLYGVYRVVRWPFAGLWGLGRGLLQLANILGEPEASPAPPKHLVVDFRGAWYTGTSLMNRFGPTRRLYQWLRSWYCMGKGRLKRWYGEDYHFEEVTFQGRLHGNTAFYLFERLEKLKDHRLPSYHLIDGERPQLPARDALCRVHFKGDYDLASAQGLGLVLYDVWRKHYPITVKPNDSENEPSHRQWYKIPLKQRVKVFKIFKFTTLFGLLSMEYDWVCERFKVSFKDGALHQDDVVSLPRILSTVDSYFDSLKATWQAALRDLDATASMHGIGHSRFGDTTRQPYSTSFKSYVIYDRSLNWKISEQGKRDIRKFLRKTGVDIDSPREEGLDDLSAESQALQGEFESAQAQRAEINRYWDEMIASEKRLGEFERTHTGFWGFWQDLFGQVRLRPKSPEGVSTEAIQGRVGEPGVSGVDDRMVPLCRPDNRECTGVFSEPQQPQCEPAATSESGVRDITPPSDVAAGLIMFG